jgi:4-hydroxyphenylpyruvate dioxygenase
MNPLCLNLFQFSPYVSAGRPVPPLDALLGATADAGFELVGLDMYSLTELGIAPGDLRRALARHGLRCFEMLGLQVDDDDATAGAMADEVARWVGESGAEWVLTVSDGSPGAALVERFAACADRIVAQGGRLALEFIPFMSCNTIAAARSLCDAVGNERAKILIDDWHVFRGTDSLLAVAATPVDAIGYVQFDDAFATKGALADEIMTSRTWPGNGELDLAGFASAVKQTGYAGPVSIELLNSSWHHDGIGPSVFARQAMASSAPYWR